MPKSGAEFFWTARERYQIAQRRAAGLDRSEWTQSKPFQDWRFCNVHREMDRTTAWFADNVRSKLSGLDVVKATIAFRWFNRIETAERILPHLLKPSTWNSDEVRYILQDVKPVVSGAYIILGQPGYSKLDGVLACIDNAFEKVEILWAQWEEVLEEHAHESDVDDEYPVTLQRVWIDLRTIDYLGGFTSYEIVSDLRWTDVLESAPDIMTWANAGPGCARGLGWVTHGNSSVYKAGSRRSQEEMLLVMTELLEMSRDEQFWPQEWPRWEMREVEHWACEFDKFNRALRGDRMKRAFR